MPYNINNIQDLLPGKISTSTVDIQKHAGQMFYINQYKPDAICYPESEQDILTLVDYCLANNIPLIPYGSGTSVEGHTAAVNGGICVNMSKMSNIVEFSPNDHYITVQSGLPYNELNDYLMPYHMHFPVEAGWGASIGGMIATNASGAGATDAGSMAKNVASCTLITYDKGRALKVTTGTKSLKSSAGYNLNNLLIGSEGTLGIITSATLRIRNNFNKKVTIICQFTDISQAIDAVIDLKKQVHFRRVELMDTLQTKACVTYSNNTTLQPDKNTLIIELAGNPNALTEEIKLVINNIAKYGASQVAKIEDLQEANKIWMMRKNALPAAIALIDKNKKAINTDISVPLSKLAECIKICNQHVKHIGLAAPLVAHVGDGNFHYTILVDTSNKDEMHLAKKLNSLVVDTALKLGGSCTGEHGIGIGKMDYLKQEHGDSIFLMRHIKNALDPLGIFNPGKIFQT